MTVWLSPEQVAERIGVARRTAMALMLDMNPVCISGNVHKRMRVSEESLERWMISRATGKPPVTSIKTGSKKKLERRK